MNLIYMVLGVCIDGGAFTSKKKDGGGISNIQQVGLSRCKMVSKAPKDNNLHTDE